jgi:polyhydroxyalkanoate synthase
MTTKCDAQPSYSQALDRMLQANLSPLTSGISPAALTLAFVDWYIHLMMHPSKQADLIEQAQGSSFRLGCSLINMVLDNPVEELAIKCPPLDKRFADQDWQQYPYNVIYQSFLLLQEWWDEATTDIHGISLHHEQVINFTMRQILDMFSPSNSPFINPEVLKATWEQQGQNFINGFYNFIEDSRRSLMNEPPYGAEAYVVGENMAISPGKVIYRNDLIELIQYEPLTKEVYANPILITPAWIMKYYILDLTPRHSLVRYLVKRGHTVFMISWKNPDEKYRDFGMEDYLQQGIMAALKVVTAVVPRHKIHLIGYCLGGTLSAIAAATLARDAKPLLASMTLLAAQVDFTEPGELGLFIDESQISYLENLMWDKGYLDTHQMLGVFQLLRSNDLIWSRLIREYLLGQRTPMKDLMAWNSDATRMPYRMHSEYLRNLFLNNKLAEGNYQVGDKPIALSDINIPLFVVATERDHVSPWRSVFKINLLTTVDVTFVLTSGGHNVGIVSLPVKKTKRHYRISTLKEQDRYVDPDRWNRKVKAIEGSWWPALESWLSKHSRKKIDPPAMGCKEKGYRPLEAAPGTYVKQK